MVNHWLVFITYLQHSDPQMPHYEASQWTFARGAAATIDREFGFVGKHIFHDIIETHVLHHYVSRIPFYNAREASEAIKKLWGFIINIVMKICGSRYGNLLDGVNLSMVIMGF